MKIKKLSSMPYAQAHVEIDNEGNVFLFSYLTLTAILTANGWLEITGLYSTTTRKHIGAFMAEYVIYPSGAHGSYHDAKACYTGKYRLNTQTGEIEDIQSPISLSFERSARVRRGPGSRIKVLKYNFFKFDRFHTLKWQILKVQKPRALCTNIQAYVCAI